MRRRGRWGRSRSSGGPRLLDKVKEASGLGLAELRALERPHGLPAEVELGGAAARAAVVASSRDGVDLIGWAQVAADSATSRGSASEVIVVAPDFGRQTRAAAAWAAERGPVLRLVSLPALAGEGSGVQASEIFPARVESLPQAAPVSSVLDRLVRVLEGAALLTDAAAVRRTAAGYVLYVRGTVAMRFAQDGDGVALEFVAPERRKARVTDSSFPRWGVELQESVVQLAQDPRLLEGAAALRDKGSLRASADTNARLTGRWLVWNPDGSDPLDWVGIDEDGRPVLGLVRSTLGLAEAAGVVAARAVFEDQRELWAPGAAGEPRFVFSGEEVEAPARALLERLGLRCEILAGVESGDTAISLDADPERGEGDRRGRRRRRRRRGRDDELEGDGDAEAEAPERTANASRENEDAEAGLSADASTDDADGEFSSSRRGRGRDRSGRGRRGGRGRGRSAESDADQESSGGDALASEEPAPLGAEEEAPEPRFAGPERSVANVTADPGSTTDPDPFAPARDAAPDADEDAVAPGLADSVPSPDVGAPPEVGSPVDEEIEATLAEEEPSEEEPEPLEPEPVKRPRRSRSAIIVRDDPDTILAGLVLARERRSVVMFYVCPQDGLMNFFKTSGTDIGDNVDILLLGFTAQPVPIQVIQTAEIYRGRLIWLDHHEWAIEDLERLREAIGRESIVFVQGAASSLAAVMDIAERRSRFTDKLVELSARRLSESEMEKWGYRLVGLLKRLAGAPGDHRSEVQPIIAGKPTELPEADGVYAEEEKFVEQEEVRLVYFGEYPMVVAQVPEFVDPGEVARRLRAKTGARLSLTARAGDEVVIVGCNDEKRHINVLGMIEHLDSKLPWATSRPAGDRVGRLHVEDLPRHPERLELVISEIVRHKSILYG